MKNENPNQSESLSQCKLLLAHLRTGAAITGIEALNLYGCFRLPSRICDLRKAGHAIKSRYILTPTGKRIKEYSLIAN